MPNLRFIPLCALAVALLCSFGSAQSPASVVRILNRIDENHLVALKGNVNPLANAANDRGLVSAGLAMADLTLVLSRNAEQQAAFDAFVESQYDAGSANFHQWLSPQQIGERFGPAQADIATISSWLANQGFAVTAVSPDRMTISFSGTAGQVQSAFHTQIHNLSVKGIAHIANVTDPQIPEALSAVVIGVKGLHNFLPHPLHRTGNKVQLNDSTGGWQRLQDSPALSLASGGVPVAAPVAQPAASLRPMYTYTSGTSVVQDITPYDFATIYNILPLWQKSTPINGTGQTIAIIGTSGVNASDIATFKSTFGLPAGLAPIQARGVNGVDPGVCSGSTGICGTGDLEENTLDVEWAGATAPGAQVVLVTSGYNDPLIPTNDPIFQSAAYVINNVNTTGSPVFNARIISISYGMCELGMGTASNVVYRNLWQTAAAAGIAVFVASGDSGSPACDQGGDADGNPYSAQFGLAVNGLASTPFNTAVGGTDFNWCKPSYNSSGTFQGCTSTNASTFWNSTNISGTQATAKGYVPETPWNDSCLNPVWATYIESLAPLVGYSTPANPEAACNFVYNNWKAINSAQVTSTGKQFVMAWAVDSVGAGGGASNCVVNNGNNSSSCTSSTTSTGSSYGNLTLVNDGWPKPTWQTGVSGIPADGVRDLPDVSFFSGDGSLNSATLVCLASVGAACTGALSGSAVEIGGTSVATPEMAGIMALINQNAGSPQGNPNAQLYALAGKQTYSSCSSESVTAGSASCYFNDIDQGTISMPCAVSAQTIEGGAIYTGSTWNVNATTYTALASPNCAALNSGDKVGTLVSSGTTPGFNALTGFDLATGLGSLNVANVVNGWTTPSAGAIPTISVTPASSSVDSDINLGVTVTVAGGSGTPTGTVSLLAGSYIGTAMLSAGSAAFTVPAGSFTSAGSQPMTVTYNGNSTYGAASKSASVTVNYVYFTMSGISSPASIAVGASATATATISTSNNYDGTVSLACYLTGGPSTSYAPTCALSSPTTTLTSTKTTSSVTLTVKTTKTSAAISYPKLGDGKGWLGSGAGTVLALLVFLGIPARRRSWRRLLGIFALTAVLSTLSACGGGGSSSSGNGTTTTGTASGTYTFGVWAVGDPAIAAPAKQTFTVTVN